MSWRLVPGSVLGGCRGRQAFESSSGVNRPVTKWLLFSPGSIWEVRGSSTKPFGFMPFYPGPGLMAYIPIDPYLYLELQGIKIFPPGLFAGRGFIPPCLGIMLQRVGCANERKASKMPACWCLLALMDGRIRSPLR